MAGVIMAVLGLLAAEDLKYKAEQLYGLQTIVVLLYWKSEG